MLSRRADDTLATSKQTNRTDFTSYCSDLTRFNTTYKYCRCASSFFQCFKQSVKLTNISVSLNPYTAITERVWFPGYCSKTPLPTIVRYVITWQRHWAPLHSMLLMACFLLTVNSSRRQDVIKPNSCHKQYLWHDILKDCLTDNLALMLSGVGL